MNTSMKADNNIVTPITINGIDWNLDRHFSYGKENQKYVTARIEASGLLPLADGTIEFNWDIWDFRPYYKFKKDLTQRFSFEKIPLEYKITLKYFVLLSILNEKHKISTIKRRFSDLVTFLRYLVEHKIYSVETVCQKDIENFFLDHPNWSPKTQSMNYIALSEFEEFLRTNYDIILLFNTDELNEKNRFWEKVAHQTQANKTKDIPEEYFNQLLSFLIKIANDQKKSYVQRATACLYIIMSQTGLRLTEIISLETDSLKTVSTDNFKGSSNSEYAPYYLEYKNFKKAHGPIKDFVIDRTFANELTINSFNILVSIRPKMKLPKEIEKLLFTPTTVHTLPVATDYLVRNFIQLAYDYFPIARNSSIEDYPDLHCRKVEKNKRKGSVVIPSSKQFRVHAITELYHRNVPLLFIKRYMGHLYEDMTAYYVRPKEIEKKELEAKRKVLEEIITNKATPLGNDSKDIVNNIKKFIEKNNYNVEKDLNTIIDELSDEFVIRMKRNGVCIKTSRRACARDARTDKIHCAYDLCPNLFHFFYNATETYQDIKDCEKTYKYNKKNDFISQASKELNKLKAICKQRFIPEMQDLKKRLDKFGTEKVINDYPDLLDIVNNYDQIMKEVESWLKKRP